MDGQNDGDGRAGDGDRVTNVEAKEWRNMPKAGKDRQRMGGSNIARGLLPGPKPVGCSLEGLEWFFVEKWNEKM